MSFFSGAPGLHAVPPPPLSKRPSSLEFTICASSSLSGVALLAARCLHASVYTAQEDWRRVRWMMREGRSGEGRKEGVGEHEHEHARRGGISPLLCRFM